MTGRANLRERLANTLPQIAPQLSAEQVLAYWFRQDSLLDHELLDNLAALRHGGLLVYLATNQEHERARYLMETLGLAAHVDGCHYSAAVGHCKPTPEFFDAVARKVGLPAGELLLVDDSEENVRAAIAAGWQAAHWTGRQRMSDLIVRR